MSAAAAAAGGAGMLPALHPAAGLGPMMMGGLSSDQLNVLCMQAAVAAMQVHGNPGWPLPGMPGVPSQVGWPKGFDPANPLGAPVRTFLHHLSRPIWAGSSTPGPPSWPLGTGHERLAHTCCCECGQGIPEQAAAAAAAVVGAATGAQGQAGVAGSDCGSPNPQSGRRRGRPRKGQEMTDEERKARRKEINRQAGNARPAHHPMHRLAHFFKMPTERLRDGLFFAQPGGRTRRS